MLQGDKAECKCESNMIVFPLLIKFDQVQTMCKCYIQIDSHLHKCDGIKIVLPGQNSCASKKSQKKIGRERGSSCHGCMIFIFI